ncbi:MAG: DUF448 domain-containing protein [Pseudomonadota bacterium]
MSEPSQDTTVQPFFGKKRANPRRCVGTGSDLAPEDPALRFVLNPQGELVLDLKGSLPGRGTWLSPSRSALEAALKKGGFQRGFKGPAKLPEGMDADAFAAHIDERLRDAALSRLGLCRKAGKLAIGHDAARKAVKKGIAYATPTDASAPEVEKLSRFLAKAGGVPHLLIPTDREVLSAALDQDAVHLLLLSGGPSRGAMEALELWQLFSRESGG